VGLLSPPLIYRRKDVGEVSVRLRLFPRSSADGTMEMLKGIDFEEKGPPKALSRVSTETAEGSTRPVTMEDKTHIIEFSIQDNGPGIPEHLQKKVFEPFVQAEMRLSKSHDGVGLGLSICRQIIKRLGGSIKLDSELGKGSTFTIHIPLNVRDRDASFKVNEEEILPAPVFAWGKNKPRLTRMLEATHQPKPKADGNSLKILVAEDNPTNRTVILQMLKMQKFHGKLCLLRLESFATTNFDHYRRCHTCQRRKRSIGRNQEHHGRVQDLRRHSDGRSDAWSRRYPMHQDSSRDGLQCSHRGVNGLCRRSEQRSMHPGRDGLLPSQTRRQAGPETDPHSLHGIWTRYSVPIAHAAWTVKSICRGH
jgi:hypothetical protein